MKPTYTKNRETADYVLFLTSEFSQWYPSDFTDDQGRKYNCCEQYMMFNKAMLFGDHETARLIMQAETPDEQKKLGRLVKGFDKAEWDQNAQRIVYEGNYLKFTQNPHLFEVLLATKGKELVEAAHYDPIWGIGLRADDPLAEDKANWKGTNWLGGALTQLRDRLEDEGFKPVYNDDNRYMFKVRDAQGQRTLYLSDKEFSHQMGGGSAWSIMLAFASVPCASLATETFDLDIKGHGKITVNLEQFLDDNEGVTDKLRLQRIASPRGPKAPGA